MTRKLPYLISFILLVILGYRLTARSSPTAPSYQTAQASKDTLIVSVTGSGQVVNTNNASVTTQASGRVKRVYVKDGDQVTANQPIAELELDAVGKQKSSQALAGYQSAKAGVGNAKASQLNLESQMWQANQAFLTTAVTENKTASEPEYIESNRDWLAAEMKYKNQQLTVAQSQHALTSAWYDYQQTAPVIYAPISGTITGLSLQEGTVIAAAPTSTTTTASTAKIANIQTNALPLVSINITEIDVPKIAIGNKATVELDALPDKSFTGTVISLDTVGTTTSGVTTYPAVIKLDAAAAEILPNMSATATILTLVKHNALLVPSAAIQTQADGQSAVRLLVNSQPVTVAVEVGAASDTQVEIVSGIEENATVITGTTTSASSASPGSTTSVFGGFGTGRPGGGTGVVRIQR